MTSHVAAASDVQRALENSAHLSEFIRAELGKEVTMDERGTIPLAYRLFVVQATFRRKVGFVCMTATEAGQIEEMLPDAAAATADEREPFILLPRLP